MTGAGAMGDDGAPPDVFDDDAVTAAFAQLEAALLAAQAAAGQPMTALLVVVQAQGLTQWQRSGCGCADCVDGLAGALEALTPDEPDCTGFFAQEVMH